MNFVLSRQLRRLIGVAAIALSAATWATDLLHVVDPCGYCQVTRTVIGILGVGLLLPTLGNWLVQYLAKSIAAFGIVTSATQHFLAWNDISKGEFNFAASLFAKNYVHFALSGAGLLIIVGLALIYDSAATGRVNQFTGRPA